MTSSSSSGARRPIRRPSRTVDSVLIWLILTQERLGRLVDWISVFGPCSLAGEKLFSGSLLNGGIELGTLTR